MCKCCEEIQFWKEAKTEEAKKGIVESKLFSKISIITWRKGERKIMGKQCGSITTKLHPLKYCPECGRKLGKK